MNYKKANFSEEQLTELILGHARHSNLNISEIVSLIEKWLRRDSRQYSIPSEDKILRPFNLHEVAWGEFNSSDPTEATSQILSTLFLKSRNEEGVLTTQGIVLTPDWLVDEMVEMAYQSWVKENSQFKTDANTSDLNPIWFDGCVGTGNFAIGILKFIKRKRGTVTYADLNTLQLADIDEVAVQISRIRVALWLTLVGEWESFDKALEAVIPQIKVRNALLEICEQSTLIFENDTDWGKGVDIVIGNPPYVRSERIPIQSKEMLKRLYPSIWTGKSDLYHFFIANSVLRCRKSGVVCLVSPASFQRALSGTRIRQYISKQSPPSYVLDFNELEVFPGVSLDASVFVLTPGKRRATGKLFLVNDLSEVKGLASAIDSQNLVEFPIQGSHPWRPAVSHPVGNGNVKFHTLKQSGIKILSGIKTGLQEAYVVEGAIARQFLEDSESKTFLEKLILPREIDRWSSGWRGRYLVNIPKGKVLSKQSLLYNWFTRFRTRLELRKDVIGHPTWYGLRECDYLELMRKPKIIFPDISSTNRFSICYEPVLIPDGSFFIPGTNLFLLGILNSRLALKYFESFCMSIGRPGSGGRLRFKKTYIQEFKIPIESECEPRLRNMIIELVEKIIVVEDRTKLEEELNILVEELYARGQDSRVNYNKEYAVG